jgi:hypothetical protein
LDFVAAVELFLSAKLRLSTRLAGSFISNFMQIPAAQDRAMPA